MKSRLTAIALVLFVCLWRYNADYWHSKWAVMLAVLIVVIGVWVARELTLSAGVLLGYALLNALWFFGWRWSELSLLHPDAATRFEDVIAQAAFAALVLAVSAIALRKYHAEIRTALAASCWVGALYVIGEFVAGQRDHFLGGFVDQGSLMGCWLAVTFPFLVEERRKDWGSFAIPVFAAAFILLAEGKASVQWGAFIVMGVTYVVARQSGKGFQLRVALFSLGVVLSGLAFGFFFNGRLFYDSARIKIYRTMMGWWWENANVWTGKGLGSYLLWGPIIQREKNFYVGDWFIWMHGDWVEITFQLGFVGIALALWLAWDVSRACWRRRDAALLSSAMTLMAAMVFQYPLHLPMFAFLAVAIISMALKPVEVRE